MSRSVTVPEDVRACAADSYAEIAWTRLVMSSFAAYMAARYNGPVYLTGSSLRPGTPRDIDIRVIIADNEFCGRYGYKDLQDIRQTGPNQKWIDDMAKRNGELARVHRMNADFQVNCASDAIHHRGEPRVLLAAPSKLDHIAESTRWFDGDAIERTAEGNGSA